MGKEQKPKPGKVMRLDEETWTFVQSVRNGRERLSDLVRRLVGLTPKGVELQVPEDAYALPSQLYGSSEEAKGEAIYRAVKEKIEVEKPVKVRKVR